MQSVPGLYARSPAQVGTALVALVFIAANLLIGAIPLPAVDPVILHVTGAARPGWYGGQDAAEALAKAGSAARFFVGMPVDGDSVNVVGAYAVTEVPSAPIAYLATGQKLHLNSATQAELEALPHIGPALAKRIRAARPFRNVEALDAVKGIGPATIKALRPFVQV